MAAVDGLPSAGTDLSNSPGQDGQGPSKTLDGFREKIAWSVAQVDSLAPLQLARLASLSASPLNADAVGWPARHAHSNTPNSVQTSDSIDASVFADTAPVRRLGFAGSFAWWERRSGRLPISKIQ